MAVERVGQHEQLKDAARSMNLPDSWPVIRHMFVDDENRLWVAVNTNRQDKSEWWVLEKECELLARFQLPLDVSIAEVTGDQLFMQETDEETGLEQVVRYGIEME
ncbi:MAG: hypothetical protein ACNS64_12160 [Candidatus Halalkalibacterium sp. M3_1C_030]